MSLKGNVEITMKMDNSNLKKGLDEAKSSIEGLEKPLRNLKGLAGGLIVGALAASIIGVGKASIKAAADMEQYQISFEVMLGSAEKAKALLGELQSFADKTPFQMAGLADNAKMLLSFGVSIEEIMPTLKMLGDTSAGNEQKMSQMTLAFAQMSSAGRLMGQDLLQMINAGFNPLQEISKKTGKSMGELRKEMEAGNISVGMVKQAFIEATSEGGRFYQMMEKQSGSLIGEFSTLKDGVAGLARIFGNELAPEVKKTLDVMTKLVAATKTVLIYDFQKINMNRENQISKDIDSKLRNYKIFNASYNKMTKNPRVKANDHYYETVITRKNEIKKDLDDLLKERKGIESKLQNLIAPPKLGGTGTINTNTGSYNDGKDKKGKKGDSPFQKAESQYQRYLANEELKGIELSSNQKLAAYRTYLSGVKKTFEEETQFKQDQLKLINSAEKELLDFKLVRLDQEKYKTIKTDEEIFSIDLEKINAKLQAEKQGSLEYEKLLAQKLELEQNHAKKINDINSKTVVDNLDIQKQEIDSKIRNLDYEVEKHQISKTEQLRQELNFIEQKKALIQKAAEEQLKIAQGDKAAEISIRQDTNRQLYQLNSDESDNELQLWKENHKEILTFQSGIASGLSNEFKQILNGQLQFNNAFSAGMNVIRDSFSDMAAEMLKDWISTHMKMFAVSKGAAMGEALASAFTAVVNAIKSVIGIPVVGPGLAIGAAAEAAALTAPSIAGIAALAMPAFAKGGIIDGDFRQPVPIMAHGSEMVLNPNQQAQLWNTINGKNEIQSQQPVINISFPNMRVLDSKDFKRHINENMDHINEQLKKGQRYGRY